MADYNPNFERRRTGALPSDKPPSHILPLLTLLPIAAFLLFLAGISFIAAVIALALSSPLFVICSPVLVPAAAVIALALAGFLTSGAFGVTALSSLSWMANNLRTSRVPAAHDLGHSIQRKAQELGKSEDVGPAQEGEKAEDVRSAHENTRSVEVETAQEESATKDEAAQEPVKAQEGEKAQKGKA